MRRQITKLDFFWLHRKILVCAEQNKRQKKRNVSDAYVPSKKEIRNVDKMYVPLKKKVFLSIVILFYHSSLILSRIFFLTALPDTYYAIANSVKQYT